MDCVIFFLGTEAELIKIFPIIMEAKKRGVKYKIIASGQNNIVDSKIFKKINCGQVDLELSREESIKKNAVGLFCWWIKTYLVSKRKIQDAFNDVNFQKSKIVVHGDTVSTLMGARIGKKLGMEVCHVEAGLRSHHLFSPFPEEIDRLLTSRNARIHFAPGEKAVDNLRNAKGMVVNTVQNTLLDSLRFSETIPVDGGMKDILSEDYFVFVMHRQENLANNTFVKDVLNEVLKVSSKIKCVIVLHEITKNKFEDLGVLNDLKNNEDILLLPRVDYFDFMKLLNNSKFVITDGGSNQEELFYMKKPCLIMRTATERNEGIGINARLFNGRANDISKFVEQYNNNCFSAGSITQMEKTPSEIVMDTLESH